MVATAIPDIEGNLRAAMLGSALGRKFDHDPQRLADHIGVRVRRVPSTDITHWKGAHVHSSAYYCHHDGEIVISETAQGGWLTWAFSHELGHALALQDWHTSIDEGEHSCDIFARAFLSDIDDSFRQVPGARFRLQFAVTWAEARISEWKAALPGAAPFRLLNLEDSASVAQYGLRDRVLVVKDLLPLGLSVTALAQASATLYGVAVTYLARHKDPQVAYEVECVGLRHMRPDGRPYFRVGDKLTLDYIGTYTDEDGTLREDLRVRQDLYIMAATRTYGPAGESTWKLTVSTIARALPNDSDLIASMLSEIGVAKISPLPFLQINDSIRIDATSIQLGTDGSEVAAIYGLDALSDSPATNASYWKLSGSANDQILENDVTLGTYTAGTERSSLRLIYGSFSQATLNAAGKEILKGVYFGNENGAARVAPLLQPTIAFPDPATLYYTIASGVVDIATSGYYGNGNQDDPGVIVVETEGAAATDNLDSIISSTGLRRGQLVVVVAKDTTHTVVAKDGTGNLKLAGDMTLDNSEDTLVLLYNGSNWLELARSNNGA